ncbi:hypothetical protein CBM2609_A40123 [Cupriavidus taiwanensis]|nr:hypothetical protein CBM2609_A40123 [Cupriavidus taiwanensis]
MLTYLTCLTYPTYRSSCVKY